jgi:ribosome-associated protein
MDVKKLQRVVIDALEDVKAQDIKVFNTTELTSLFDRVVIASGTSIRQTRALAAHVRDMVKERGGDVVSVEGEDTGEWVLVDLGDIIEVTFAHLGVTAQRFEIVGLTHRGVFITTNRSLHTTE